MFLFFVVIAAFHDHVKYGLNEGSHLLGIFTDEAKAKAVVIKYADIPEHQVNIGHLYNANLDSLEKDYRLHEFETAFDGGHYDICYRGFVPGMDCGGGFYIE